MILPKKLAGIVATSVAAAALTACAPVAEDRDASVPAATFGISAVVISPMTGTSLCRDLGGRGEAPTVTVEHSAVAGVPLRLHLQDRLSDGSTFDHRSLRVMSDGSGTTTVTPAFLPPCNTTGGRLDSHYQLTVEAGGEAETITWAQFDSASRTIR